MNAYGLAPLLIILPFVGFLFNALVGRRFVEANRHNGERWTGWLASGMALAAFGVTVLLLLSLTGDPEHVAIVTLFEWINVPSADFSIPWAMHIDTLSVTMLMVVTGVGSLIHIYAIGYMHGDEDFSRFFAYLNLFLFFMIILVTGSSYLMLFVGWEGVGLCSFLLIGFWWAKTDKKDGEYVGVLNANAARKAFVANRVGDLAMIVAMILTFWAFGSMEFVPVFEHAVDIFEHGEMVALAGTGIEMPIGQLLTWITGLFLLGAAGKSAQIPLYIWLPDAMAGPTPVSALIHAATMVTSGIYLLVRSNVLLEIVRESGYRLFGLIPSTDLIALTGAATALVAGLIAFTQFDIKKVLAYSTVSQLGFMIAAAGMGAYVAAIFHLVTHAFFKALLFLGSGSVIHGMEHGHHHVHAHHKADAHGHHPAQDHHDDFDPQDMRTMGGLRHMMPITFVVYMIGALALAGIVPLAGFWSKDEILAHASSNSGGTFTAVYWLLTIAAFCTAFYMGRQLKMTFFGAPRHEAAKHAHESPPVMTRPLIILAALAVFAGVLNVPYLSAANAPDHGGGEHAALVAARTSKVLAAEEGEDKSNNLWLEHFLEPAIESFHLTEEGVVHMPKTPIVLSPSVAGVSTLLALLALAGAFFGLYRSQPDSAESPDPLFRLPVLGSLFTFMQRLPLDTLVMKGIVPQFNRFANFAGYTVDWEFWHNWFHERVIRGSFLALAGFTSRILDVGFVDGVLVLGTGRFIRGAADALRQVQTGYVRNYALGLFLGVVALVAFFIFGG